MNERIVCKPTPWFLLRAAAMLLMFGVFAVMFYVDGKWGYREKNLSFYVSKAFEQATQEFNLKKDRISPEDWRAYAEKQSIDFVHRSADDEVGEVVPVPEGTPVPMAWPPILLDHAAWKASLDQQPGKLFNDYRLEADIRKEAPENAFPARKIFEQWVVFWVCLVLAIGAVVVLLRTIRRSIAIDGEALYPAGGGKVTFGQMTRLDLRKWETKGLASVWARTASGEECKLTIDGLTYGGFKKEQDEPAERLMVRLRENFSGELIEYVTEPVEPGAGPSADA